MGCDEVVDSCDGDFDDIFEYFGDVLGILMIFLDQVPGCDEVRRGCDEVR